MVSTDRFAADMARAGFQDVLIQRAGRAGSSPVVAHEVVRTTRSVDIPAVRVAIGGGLPYAASRILDVTEVAWDQVDVKVIDAPPRRTTLVDSDGVAIRRLVLVRYPFPSLTHERIRLSDLLIREVEERLDMSFRHYLHMPGSSRKLVLPSVITRQPIVLFRSPQVQKP
jgi:hypothetical protein